MTAFVWWYPKLVRKDDGSYTDETYHMPGLQSIADRIHAEYTTHFMFGHVIELHKLSCSMSAEMRRFLERSNAMMATHYHPGSCRCDRCQQLFDETVVVSGMELCCGCIVYLRLIYEPTDWIPTPYDPYESHLIYLTSDQQIRLRYMQSTSQCDKVFWYHYARIYWYAKHALVEHLLVIDIVRVIIMYVLSGVYV